MSTEEFGPRQRAAATKRKRTIARTVSAAALLFDAHGWYGVTLDDIAREAGVSVAAFNRYFATKQAVALAAYAPMLLPVVEQAEANSRTASATLRAFIYELAEVAVQCPVLTISLLPASRDITRIGDEARSTSAEVVLVDFDQIAELLGRLLANHQNNDDNFKEVSEIYLSGLLSWVLKHPDRSGEDAARLLLSQLL
ncbi:helix-turn-helix domain containing protein [Streptomyces gilvifuscus]|uniref:Helix-turn-helix domain containing protein n=1 Tax=Streptomyces gilvifuscus TaxID=1550617 RepID=A0ABT5G027_9ACTN|nr:TetR/AcrR family transcriptional regulator [Streptomyces gilvifuscus]MDC2958145.1 helix-turn-helix domain containing protein [Streptomyces gilvifuscus]